MVMFIDLKNIMIEIKNKLKSDQTCFLTLKKMSVSDSLNNLKAGPTFKKIGSEYATLHSRHVGRVLYKQAVMCCGG